MTDIDALQKQSPNPFAGLLDIRFLEATRDLVRAQLSVRDELCTRRWRPAWRRPHLTRRHGRRLHRCPQPAAGRRHHHPRIKDQLLRSCARRLHRPRRGRAAAPGPPHHRRPHQDHLRGRQAPRRRHPDPDGARAPDAGGRLQPPPQEQPVLSGVEGLASLFAGKGPAEQKALLAQLERAGAALYRAWAAREPDAAARQALLAAAEREEQNARVLEGG